MGYNTADVAAAQGRYLTCKRDPRIAPGLDYIPGTVIVFGTILLQKKSTVKTDWEVVGSGGGGGTSWGAPGTVTTVVASGPILPTTSAVLADASDGPLSLALPNPAAALQAIAIKKIDGTGNLVTVTTPAGTIDDLATFTGLFAKGNSAIFISNLLVWSVF